MALAKELRAWREAKGWTRQQAADYLGVNLRTLEGWEQGRRQPPSLKALQRLLRDAPAPPKRSRAAG